MGYGCKPLPAQCAQSAEQTCDSCFGDDLPSSCDTCSDGIGIELTCANL